MAGSDLETNLETSELDKLTQISMEIIIHAGAAQSMLMQVVKGLSSEMDEALARRKLEEAKDEISKAHATQTAIIQSEASGEKIEYSLLFNHAQDTLMMAQAEHVFVTAMLDVYTNLANRIKKLEDTK